MVIFGTRLFGKVDQFNGLHVATKFFHINYLPLFPTESWIVVNNTDDGWQGIRLPEIRWRSVLMAWVRAALVLWLVFTGFGLLLAIVDGRFLAAGGAASGVMFGAAIAAMVGSYKVWKGSRATLARLARSAGLDENELLGPAEDGLRARAGGYEAPTGV